MIEKITDQNLEKYDSRLKEWCDRKFFKKGNYGKYQTTEKAGAVAFYPAPNTPLEGKVKFSFKETMPTEGTKGPDNPSIITGVSNITVTHCESEGVDSINYTISFGNTYYGGEIDLATGVMTVTNVCIDMSDVSIGYHASQTMDRDVVACYWTASPARAMIVSLNVFRCNRFACETGRSNNNAEGVLAANNSGNMYMYINKSRLGTIDYTNVSVAIGKFQDYFSENQTLVTYPIKTPVTIQLTPQQILSLTQQDKYTPRLNTIYTDADSIQISYLKSSIRDEYEKTQAILSLGGNS